MYIYYSSVESLVVVLSLLLPGPVPISGRTDANINADETGSMRSVGWHKMQYN